jgi:hypothetical protein
MEGCGLLFRNVGPETKALGFSMQSISLLYGPEGQDDELVIDNQGFWLGRSCEGLPQDRAITRPEQFTRRKAKIAADAARGRLLVEQQ